MILCKMQKDRICLASQAVDGWSALLTSTLSRLERRRDVVAQSLRDDLLECHAS